MQVSRPVIFAAAVILEAPVVNDGVAFVHELVTVSSVNEHPLSITFFWFVPPHVVILFLAVFFFLIFHYQWHYPVTDIVHVQQIHFVCSGVPVWSLIAADPIASINA